MIGIKRVWRFLMGKYDVEVLNALLDKFEKSKLSKEGSQRSLRLTIKSSHPILKDYWGEESYLYKDQIDMILDDLVRKDFISVQLTRNRELDFIELRTESVPIIYEFLNRQNPDLNRIELLKYLSSYVGNNHIIKSFTNEMSARLRAFQNFQSYFENIDDLKLCIKAIESMALLKDDILKRNFSKMVFKDSKLFEKIENKVLKIIREYDDSNSELNDEELLASFHIIKTPTFAYIKGGVLVKLKEQVIDLQKYGHEIALSSTALKDIDIVGVYAKKVITIENLTTFVAFNKPGYIVIYLGGYHNSVKRTLIKKIREFDTTIDFYHFGDIDVGGLQIYEDLNLKTDIDFIPYMMDINTLKKHKEYWSNLTQNDRKRLVMIKDARLEPLVAYMIENNCKLEQEAIEMTDLPGI